MDRFASEPNLEPIDVIMATLDAENFLEKCLYTAYREIPIRKLFVCDGGSKDETHEILKRFPRIEIHIRSDIRTTGKVLEFLLSLVETEWFVLLDGDIQLASGWYDEMCKYKGQFDVLENSRVINAYHMYREEPDRLNDNHRSGDMCHLARKSALQNFHCDDDYMWRHTDIFMRQIVEKSGYKYGKVSTTLHVENETERIRYESDNQKNFQKFVWDEPRLVILDMEKFKEHAKRQAKAIVKYLDPQHPLLKDLGYDFIIRDLDRKWVEENGPQWLERYDRINSLSFRINWSYLGFKSYIYNHFTKKLRNSSPAKIQQS